MVAENVAQGDRGATEEAAAEVVPRVSDRRTGDVVRREVNPVVLEGELARVGQTVIGRIEQCRDGDRLLNTGGVRPTRQVPRGAEALRGPVNGTTLPHLGTYLF